MAKQREKPNRITSFKSPVTYPKYASQVKTAKFFNFNAKFDSIVLPDKLETTQKWISYPTRYKMMFPSQTIRPKVQKLRFVEPFCLPKDVAVGRKRKQYAKIDFLDLLDEMEINDIDIYPLHAMEQIYPQCFKSENIFNTKFFLPLDWFDNKDLDVYNEKDWLELGEVDGERHALPALGFVPNLPYKDDTKIIIENEDDLLREHFKIKDSNTLNFHSKLYVWRMIAVSDYDENRDHWLITDLETFKSFYLHRIYFKFVAEDPVGFANRIKFAIQSRTEHEKIIKFETVLDSLHYQMKFPRLTSIEKLIEKIFNIAVSKRALQKHNQNFLEFLKEQIHLQFNRNNSRYEFLKYLQRQAEFKFLDPAASGSKQFKKDYKMERLIDDLKKRIERLIFITLYYAPEVVAATEIVTKNCLELETMKLFSCTVVKVTALDEFLSTQSYHVKKNISHITRFWVGEIADHVHILLRQTGKGWMDVYIKDWFVFENSKIFYFLNQIQMRMEDSLQFFLENSILGFTDMLCGPCQPMMQIENDYVWETTFKISPFVSKTHVPVFYIVINMCESGACLSTNPDEFMTQLTRLYHTSLIQCTPVPIINARVMKNLLFAKNLYLYCGDHIEELYHEKLDLLTRSYIKALIPLKAYTHTYDQFHYLYHLIIPDFIRDVRQENHTANELKEMVIQYKKLKQHLIDILPLRIIIGPFNVNVEPIKSFLVNKYQAIVDALLVYYTDRMREINEELLNNLTYIFKKISDKASSIEHLLEIKDFITTVPSQLETIGERIKVMNYEYDILDYFLYNLSNEQFDMKWQVIAYPYRIIRKISEANELHKNEIEVFKKIQISELAGYSDRLESINEEVTQFGYVFDTNKVEENAVDAKKLWKLIQDMNKMGKVLKLRQEIFELEEYSLDFIISIESSFQPYYDLWSTCLSIIKLEDLCIGNPINSLDINDIKGQFENYKNVLKSLYMIFSEKLEIQNVATEFLERIDSFAEVVTVLEWLKNENWLLMHWKELNAKAKIDIKYTANINFNYCQKKGIMKFIDLVKEIGQRAVDEADEIRQRIKEEEERKKREEEEQTDIL